MNNYHSAAGWLKAEADRFYRAVGYDVAELMKQHDDEFRPVKKLRKKRKKRSK